MVCNNKIRDFGLAMDTLRVKELQASIKDQKVTTPWNMQKINGISWNKRPMTDVFYAVIFNFVGAP